MSTHREAQVFEDVRMLAGEESLQEKACVRGECVIWLSPAAEE